jgi:His/Glu/Gln/Arg/opine family amino acid ABC transporter permease subunit
MEESWAYIREWSPELAAAALQTLKLTFLSFIVAAVVGVPICALRVSHVAAVRYAAASFIEVIRGLPILVLLFLLYFGLPAVLPSLRWSSVVCAVIGFGLQGGVQLAEIYRAGLGAIDRGEREAALALGLTPLQRLIHVSVPQAFNVSLPPTGNYLVGLLKDTSIASIIAAPELMLRAKDLSSSSFMPMPIYLFVALIYFIMSYPLSVALQRAERRMVRA